MNLFALNGIVQCPECGAALQVSEGIERFNPRTGVRDTVKAVALCGECEFVHIIPEEFLSAVPVPAV